MEMQNQTNHSESINYSQNQQQIQQVIGEEKEQSWEDRVLQLSQEVANDCNLKKGLKTKFIKHAELAGKIWSSKPEELTPLQYMLLAGMYKNLGKLGEHEQFLEKALVLLKKAQGLSCVVIRWTLQLIAFKSSAKKREQCYAIALKTIAVGLELLQKMIMQQSLSQEQRMLGQFVFGLSKEETKDEVIWLYNDRNMAEEMLFRLRKTCNEKLPLPFYHDYEFHIADVMTLESCRQGWHLKQSNNLRDLVIYISICCFTLATEKYYLKDYTQKCNHIKALRIALAAFEINCTYVVFLTKILQEHFGKNMHPIAQEHQVRGDSHELMYYLPKEKREVSLLGLNFADQ